MLQKKSAFDILMNKSNKLKEDSNNKANKLNESNDVILIENKSIINLDTSDLNTSNTSLKLKKTPSSTSLTSPNEKLKRKPSNIGKKPVDTNLLQHTFQYTGILSSCNLIS